MSTEANKALIHQWIETGLDAGEVDSVDLFFSPAYVSPGIQGTAALKQALRAMRNAFPDLRVQIEELVAEQDKVVARFAYPAHIAGRSCDGSRAAGICVGRVSPSTASRTA